ncbi:MAG: beta-CASP ribonuclease aCPSF1 [Candidatus Nanoarchaeia archaeon]
MADIISEMLKLLVDKGIKDAAYEGANIVLYTTDMDFFLNGRPKIKELVSQFKKRIELRAHPSMCADVDKTKESINKLLSKEAGVSNIIFDPPRSEVVIEAEKPGLAIGKQGDNLRRIREETHWAPLVKRTPPLRSEIIENIRAVLYDSAEYRKEFLHKVGERMYANWQKGKRANWVRLTYLGAARQVGRSCLFVQTPESRIIMDCGVDVASDEEPYPFLEAPEFDIQKLDAVLITHAHTDHSGFIPYLFKYGYRGPVYCTAPTRDVMILLMLDYIKIAHAEAKNPVYTVDDVKEMLKHIITVNWEEVTDITSDVRMTFYDSGHILGSSMIHLNVGNGFHNMLYTGDLKYAKTNLLNAAHTQFPRLETVMIESTYGGKGSVQPCQKEQDAIFADIVKKTVERGGKIIMPVLGSGKAQEVMVMLEGMVRRGEIPEMPVYIDGMVWDITAIHTAYPEFLNPNVRKLIFHKDQNPFLHPIFRQVGSQKERIQLADLKGPCYILATSGMLVGGPSVQYLQMLADDPKHSLIFSCYQGPGTLGRRILQGEREISVKMDKNRTEIIPIKLEVHKIVVSSHADRTELMKFIQDCSPRPRRVIVNHGENSQILDLASSIHKQFRMETTAPRNLETIRLR